MKYALFLIGSMLLSLIAKAQKEITFKDSMAAYQIDSMVTVRQLNGFYIYSDSFYNFIHKKIESNKSKIHFSATVPKIYFTNSTNTQYFEIISAPDIGWEQYYCIGYTKNSKCDYCGDYLGKLNDTVFAIDNGVKLGESYGEVNKKMNLLLGYYRYFPYGGVTYFYYEKGTALLRPYMPENMYYYKFKNNTLIEIGFGHGSYYYNPMFQKD